jgi:NitT/TauT family transport system ATP-binding protein
LRKEHLAHGRRGLEKATSGDIAVGGQRVLGPVPSLGIVFQDPTLLPWKSALENILYPARIRRLPLEPVRQKALEMLELVGLGGFENSKPRELSGGMRQRVALCRALVYEPRLLLLDEPFSALDAITREEMNKLLADIWDRVQTAALLVTHSLSEAILLSDRILVMSNRPSRIIADIAVPFPRPRSVGLLDTAEFTVLSRQLRHLIADLPPSSDRVVTRRIA